MLHPLHHHALGLAKDRQMTVNAEKMSKAHQRHQTRASANVTKCSLKQLIIIRLDYTEQVSLHRTFALDVNNASALE